MSTYVEDAITKPSSHPSDKALARIDELATRTDDYKTIAERVHNALEIHNRAEVLRWFFVGITLGTISGVLIRVVQSMNEIDRAHLIAEIEDEAITELLEDYMGSQRDDTDCCA